jgi:exodeoxyribonuclease V beta subunit
MTVFDLLDAPLEGSNLIEASAGTGKTHNIVGLFVRLIIEKELTARDILVVTYTIAATEELRDRIRRRLVETEGALRKGEGQDSFTDGLIRKIQMSGRTEVARRLLRAAIRDFDEAAIYTIHGFCYRMLQEHAFESGALFETELIPDEDAIKREFAQDFWRRNFYEAPAEFVAYSLGKHLNPDYYLGILKQAYPNPTVMLIPESPPPDKRQMGAEIRQFHNLFLQLQHRWDKEKDAVGELLRQPGLNGRIYGKKVDTLLETLAEFFDKKRGPFPLPAGFEKITAKKIGESVNKGHLPPAHSLFDLADRLRTQAEILTERFEDQLLFLRMEIVRQGRIELPRRKERRNILAYDDLLNDLYGALRTERGHRLAVEIRSRFQAVLIDEFQDTDPVQYAIFKSLFLADEKIEQRPFFVIGDPKQAIYAFRGADIFAYIEASRAMNRTYTLKENWRSEPDLLTAVNTLFGTPQKPFLYDEIRYRPVTAADQADRDLLLLDNRQEPPFQWWLIPEETENNRDEETAPDAAPAKGLAKSGLYPQVAASVASEVARLIRLGVEGRAMIGAKPLQAEDMAILVRTNREADIMRDALVKWNIPHVVSSRESVFHSPEAEDIRRILSALAEPRNPALVRAALVTDIMGMTGDDIHALSLDETGWEEILRRFHLYHALWTSRGFIRMFRSFLENEHIPSTILKIMAGERRLTNLLHIGELLHQAATTNHLAIHDLIKWLSDQISSGETQPEEYELRLEREEKAVKVVTIHKSKGLEYPIVFCPFSWGGVGPGKNRDHVLYHDPAQSFVPVLDFGSADFVDHGLRYEEESLAEDIRLLYVALTRAKHRTYYIWGRIPNARHSASAYLFHQGPDLAETNLARAVRERYQNLSGADFLRDLENLAGSSGHTIRIQTLTVAEEKPYRPATPTETLTCREFSGRIDPSWKVASYTSLVANSYGNRDRYDDDHAPQREMKPAPEEDHQERVPAGSGPLDMFGFPGGTKAGIFLHEVLEKIDYRGDDPHAARNLVLEKLAQYGYHSHWAPALLSMVKKVTGTPFPLFPGEKRVLSLSQIPSPDRRNEVEFYFPLRRISGEDLARVFRKGAVMSESGLSKVPKLHCLERLQFSPLQGYLKGFIDLLFCFEGRFFLLDWKSNHLGNKSQDYGQNELMKVMDEGYYFVQYHLYALALHQYLAFRVPGYRYEDHFGGVYYCFLRGMDPDGGSINGVFHDRPPLALLEMMKEVLIRPAGV